MNKFKFSITYKVGTSTFIDTSLKTKYYSIEYKALKNHLKLIMHSNVPLEIKKLEVSVPFVFKSDDRIFPNGFQSWTDCREMFIDETPQHQDKFARYLLENTRAGATGDYSFTENISVPGMFYGFSYLYVRQNEKYNLFASLNERTGYTIIKTNCIDNYIIFEKDLEGVTINGNYEILDVVELNGSEDEVFERWFQVLNIPKPKVKKTNGYTTWYNYYSKITEQIVERDLESLSTVNAEIDIFQIDDGFQTATGDWLSIDNKKFPKGMKYCVDIIHKKNMKAGLWLAPFAIAQNSKIVKNHKDWLLKDKKNKPLKCGLNWGGNFYSLDISKNEVRKHIKHYFDVVLNEWGFDMVKLDFLYCTAQIPQYNKSRGQLMCEAMDFLRECVGDKLILGCGVPLMPSFGKVDYCRIGADMDLKWLQYDLKNREIISTTHTLQNSIFRRQLDNRAFRNDPDVFLLRNENMKCSVMQRQIIANVNRIFGSLLFTSDNVANYHDWQNEMLIKVFDKSDIKVLTAEFNKDRRTVINIRYLENNTEKTFSFDIHSGIIL